MKIGVISDIHFGKASCTSAFSVPGENFYEGDTGYEMFESDLVQYLKDEKVSLLLVAGDLTSVASPQEFYYCEKKILSIAQRVGIPNENVVCCMGNHDVDWNISNLSNLQLSEGLSENDINLIKNRYQMIASYAAECNLRKFLLPEVHGPVPFSGVVERNEIVIFVLNTGFLCSREQPYPHGKLSNDQLDWFRTVAEKYENKNDYTKIVLLHHHPIQYAYPIPTEDPSMLAEASELLEIAGKYGIHLIIHGHRHHPRAQTLSAGNNWKNPITFLCAGSLAVNSKERAYGTIPNTFHIIDLQNAPEFFILHNYEYNPARGWIRTYDSREQVPLDGEMYLGKLFSPEDRDSAVQTLIASCNGKEPLLLRYCDLPDCLKFMHYNELNELFRRRLPDTYTMTGDFPKQVGIFRLG